MSNKNIFKISISLMLIFTLVFSALYIYQHAESKNETSVFTLSKLGSRGEEVRKIQKKLKELGFYSGSVDGIYGTATKQAITAFQKSCGITADGIAGKKTLLYLGLGDSSSASSGKYSESDI